jgi:hypothetical protein
MPRGIMSSGLSLPQPSLAPELIKNSQDIFSPIETFRWGFMGTAYPNRVEDFVILPYIRIGVEILSGSRRNASSIIQKFHSSITLK